MEEKELVKKAQAGDKTSIELLYRSTFTYIYKYVLSSVSNKEAAEDIASEIYVKAFTKLKLFRGESSFKTWLHAVARNEIVAFYKKKAITKNFIDFDEDYIVDETQLDLEFDESEKNIVLREVEDEKKVARILDLLKPRYSEILRLRYLIGMTIKECAESLNITENNVKVLQNRAIKQAGKLLGVNYE